MAVRREEVRVTADVNNFVTRFAAAGRAADGFANRLESADGRLAGLVQTGLALAPALVPISTLAVPAIAGLTTQLGFAALAAGTTAIAFNGVGDALTALDEFKKSPTPQNFKKLQEAMDELGPAGQRFVLAMQKVRPEMQRLQDLAQQGLLPGAADGIDEILTLMPQLEDVIFTTSKTLGDLTAEAGKNLAGPEFEDFFDYLQVTAAPILTEMGRSFGNFLEGTANMVMAFDPLSRSFSTGVLDMSRSFVEATDDLESNPSFQAFVDYVQTSGPAAVDALESIGGALIELVEAAAPVGRVALPVISTLADGISAIADSPIGPLLISTAAGVGVLGRSLALLKIVGLRGGTGDSVVAKIFAADKIKAGAAALTTVTTAQDRARLSASALADVEAKRLATARAGLAQVGKASALVAGLALSTSGLAEKTGLSNTASLALMGTIAGPWGAAIGGGVGVVMDLAAANNDLEAAMRAASTAASSETIDLVGQASALDALRAENDAYVASLASKSPLGAVRSLVDVFTDAAKEGTDATQQQLEDLMAVRQGLATIYADMNGGNTSLFGATDEELTNFATKIAPAATAAGIDLREALLSGNWTGVENAIRGYSEAQQYASTDSRAVADAMAFLNGEVVNLTTATDLNSDGVINNTDAVLANIQAMKDRADAALAAFDAETAYAQALDEGAEREQERLDILQQIADARSQGTSERADLQRQLGDAKTADQRRAIQDRISDSYARQADRVADLQERLDDYAKTLDKNTVAGRANRDIISGMASAFNALSDEQKNAPGEYEKARQALIKQAIEFGATRKQARGFADDLLQIPPRVEAKIALDKKKAQDDLDAFKREFYGLTPKTVKLFIDRQQKGILGPGGKLDRAGGFAEGGYTGDGGKYEVAGPVHRGEFVHDAATTAVWRPLFEAIHAGRVGLQDASAIYRSQRVRGYAGGGYVAGGSAGLSDNDISRLAGALSQLRPLYGDVKVYGDGSFRRELERDGQHAAMGGANFR